MSERPASEVARIERTPVQMLAALTGIGFVVLGILGFVPGVTTHYGDLSFAGRGSHAKFADLFQVSVLLNLVHLLSGVAGVVTATRWSGARWYMLGGGAFYLVLWILGLAGGGHWLPVNTADNWLHFGIAVAMIGLGIDSSRGDMELPPA